MTNFVVNMVNDSNLISFIEQLAQALANKHFVKLSLGNYKGTEDNLKNIYVKPVLIKKTEKLSFTYRYKTKDIVKNYDLNESVHLIADYLQNGFRIATIFTLQEEIIGEYNNKYLFKIRNKVLDRALTSCLSHDKEKKRIIERKSSYLQALGLTDKEGSVFKNAQDKYRQINQYIEILSTLIKELPIGAIKNVVDMGSGKGYLTFALYDYLLKHQQKTKVTGVEFRKDMVDLCNDIAINAGFNQLSFVQGTIESYHSSDINLLIALHACDTATDDAIYKGIKASADLIVVAPCCHRQIRREMEKGKAKNELNFLTKHGIFLERQSEMVTDGLRALILEYFGYRTKVFEFVSDVHTPKNVLVVGIKNKNQDVKTKDETLQKIKATKAYFGIGYHHLERLLGL
ncbi:class I SAM-dependent methyltransferase [Pedobacter sp.]|uniref:class I SAM-dependent methyltransferase n=1 Tax=Pedobacter sp. TaxID=1411316 RepID=UPI00396CE0CE